MTSDKHPNADKLSVCSVKTSLTEPPRQIVCGAKNYKVGDRVPVALPGAKLPGDFVIKRSKLRGVDSEGMMCSAKELGLGDDHGGLMILEGRPEIGTPINNLFPEPDAVFTLELTANPRRLLEPCGAWRANWTALYWTKTFAPRAEVRARSEKRARPRPFAHGACALPRPIARTILLRPIRGVKIGPSPAWLKRDLEAAGLRAINNVVDVTNWVMLELGQPLHAFDAKKIHGAEIIVRAANAGEKITTLDGKERVLDPSILVIADAQRPLVVAGCHGQLWMRKWMPAPPMSFWKARYFHPAAIRRATRLLGLHTDSSQRFARDVDPAGVLVAARRAIDLILETAGGRTRFTHCRPWRPNAQRQRH